LQEAQELILYIINNVYYIREVAVLFPVHT